MATPQDQAELASQLAKLGGVIKDAQTSWKIYLGTITCITSDQSFYSLQERHNALARHYDTPPVELPNRLLSAPPANEEIKRVTQKLAESESERCAELEKLLSLQRVLIGAVKDGHVEDEMVELLRELMKVVGVKEPRKRRAARRVVFEDDEE